jgi:hypothetical protein
MLQTAAQSMKEYHDPLSDSNAPWRLEPATDAQKRKLRFYGCRFSDHLTKGAASELIDDAMARHPEKEEQYQQWKKAEEEVAWWYLQVITSDSVGDDMGVPTREMVRDTIKFLDATQPNWRQEVPGGYAFSRLLVKRYPELQTSQAIQAAQISDSMVRKATDDYFSFSH